MATKLTRGITKKAEPIDLLKPIIEALGYEVTKKKKSETITKPSNASELAKLTEDELRHKLIAINEEFEMVTKNMRDAKDKLLAYFKKEGPTEFTKVLFSGTAIPYNRINIVSQKFIDLQLQKGYIEILTKEKKKQQIASVFAEENVTSIELKQGPVGIVMEVRVE